MLSTANIITSVTDVPSGWTFGHFCRIAETLTGQSIKIRSVFKPQERTPSMALYVDDKLEYRFKCFATGLGGSAIDLVMHLYGCTAGQAMGKISQAYQEYLSFGGQILPMISEPAPRYKVTSASIRNWNTNDAAFWQSFYIGSDKLQEYIVHPLSEYTMSNQENSFTVAGREYMYGYYRKDGTLDKIYQPKNQRQKFINVGTGYVQGSDQIIPGKNEVLIYLSSLKDIMCVSCMNLKVDLKAPGSENTMIPEAVIKQDMKTYRKVLTLFDDDAAGISAMKKYKQLYDIEFIYFNMAKDPSDAVRKHTPKPVMLDLAFKINSKLN